MATSTAGDVITEAYKQLHEKDNDVDDWFCIQHEPCYCRFCDHIAVFGHTKIEGEPIVVVFPEKDDPHLLRAAITLQERVATKIITFEQNFGKCISFYELNGLGQNAHE